MSWTNFKNELKTGLKGEDILEDILIKGGITYEKLNDFKTYGCKGDFKIYINNEWKYIDVKADKNIGKTGNIVIEDNIYRWHSCSNEAGWIYKDYEYVFFVDLFANNCYLFSMQTLKEIYKKYGLCREVQSYKENATNTIYLLNLEQIMDLGLCMAACHFDYDDFGEMNISKID